MSSWAAQMSRRGLAWLGVGLPALGLAIVAGLWLALWLSLRADRLRVETDAFMQVRGLTQSFEAHTQRALNQVDLVTRFLAYEHTRHGAQLDLSGVLREGLLRQPGVIAVTLFDAKGDRTASTSSSANYSITDREHFKVHQENREVGMYVSQPMLGRGDNGWRVFMTRRLQSQDGSFAGIVIVAVDPSYFTNFYTESQFGKQGVISLVGLDWVLRARRSGDTLWYGEAAGNNHLIHQVRNATEGTFKAESKLDGISRMLAFKVLSGYPLVVLTGLSEDEVWASHQQWSKTMLAFGVLATVMLTLAFAALSSLAQRLRRNHAQLAYVKAKFEAASDAQLDAFLILRAVRDAQGRIVDFRCEHCNDRAAEMLGVSRDRLLAFTRGELLGHDYEPRFFDMYCRVIGTRRAEEGEFQMMASDHGRWLRHQVAPVDDGVAVTSRDVTAIKQQAFDMEATQRALQASEKRLRSVTETIPALVAYIDSEQRFRFANLHYRRLLGVDPRSVVGRHLSEVRGAEIYANLKPHVESVLRGERQQFEVQGQENGRDFCYQYNYVPDTADDGEVQGFFALGFDVTALKQAERQLSLMARFDALTGLANRHQFNEKLPDALARSQRTGEALALMFLDIDHFKSINDTFGHAAGDGVLREFAERLKQCVRMTDTVARLAGDEFVVILENVHSDAEPQFVARKMVGQINRPFDIQGREIIVTTSVGIAFQRGGGVSPEELLARADKALYAAKSAGRNTYQLAVS